MINVKDTKHFKNIEIEDNHLWVDVKNKSVLIKANEQEVVVDIFEKPKKECFLGEPISTAFSFYE